MYLQRLISGIGEAKPQAMLHSIDVQPAKADLRWVYRYPGSLIEDVLISPDVDAVIVYPGITFQVQGKEGDAGIEIAGIYAGRTFLQTEISGVIVVSCSQGQFHKLRLSIQVVFPGSAVLLS